jgi:hypothetical protein
MESDRKELEQIIADAREDAAVLKRNGHPEQAQSIEQLCAQVEGAAEDYIRKISLEDARLKSGLSLRQLRRRFRELTDCGMAEIGPKGEMLFRACAVPQRAATSTQRARGRQAVRRSA